MSSWKQVLSSSFWKIYRGSPVFLSFYILSLLLVNGPDVLHVNPCYRKCVSGINISPSNKKLFTISFILYLELACLILPSRKSTY